MVSPPPALLAHVTPLLPASTEGVFDGRSATMQGAGAAPPVRPDDDLAPGAEVGEYVVVRKIGAGGMGCVYEGHHPVIERTVAIKVLSVSLAGSVEASARFVQEARAANRVRHRNIVDVFSVGRLPDGRLYLVMEYLDGKDLHKYLAPRGALGFDEGLPIVDAILAALEAAHGAGVVHRDLKPENIFVITRRPSAGDGPADASAVEVKILDFGLAKLKRIDGTESIKTRTGIMMGTPAFMSPEQCRALVETDARSDLYSLGVILYRMFTGYLPFDGPSYIDVINLHLSAAPKPPSALVGMPPSLERIILKLLEKKPDHRFQSASETRLALRACDDARGWQPTWRGQPPLLAGSGEADATPTVGARKAPSAGGRAGSASTTPSALGHDTPARRWLAPLAFLGLGVVAAVGGFSLARRLLDAPAPLVPRAATARSTEGAVRLVPLKALSPTPLPSSGAAVADSTLSPTVGSPSVSGAPSEATPDPATSARSRVAPSPTTPAPRSVVRKQPARAKKGRPRRAPEGIVTEGERRAPTSNTELEQYHP